MRSALAAVGHAFSDIENACRTQAADELAEYLLDKFPADFIPSLITMLELAKPADVIAALHRSWSACRLA